MSTERQAERDAIVAYLLAKAARLRGWNLDLFEMAAMSLEVAAAKIRDGDHLVEEVLDGGTAG